MSQYPPPYGYGQHHGQPPPQAYAYPNVPGYPAPAAVPYNPSVNTSHRDASQAAYGVNGTHIPGLGIGGAAPVNPYGNFASGAASWNPPNGPPVPTSHTPPQAPNPFHIDRPQPNSSNASNSGVPPPAQPAQEPPRPSAAVEMEEGELSEGQFEDLYEPREDVSDAPTQPIDKPGRLPAAESSQPASNADTPDGGFYGTDEDDTGKDQRGLEGRERSASYSPFLSPREVQSEIPTPDRGPRIGSTQPDAETQNSIVPGLRPAAQASTTTSANDTNTPEGPGSQSQDDPLNSFKSLQEAKKEAQKAILRLWPLGVKYQNYIDEGFDEKLIKGLFLDLHLDMPKAAANPPDAPLKAPQPHQSSGTDSSKPSQTANAQPQTNTAAKDTTSEQSQKGEERKDRIARLLAAKAAKPPAAPNPPNPPPTAPEKAAPEKATSETQQPGTSPATQTPTAPRGKTWGEKERLLQQKIAALQKAREARKSAEATAGAKAVQGEDSNNGTPKPQGLTVGSPALLSIPTGPRISNGPQRPASSQPALSQPRPLPGLSLAPNGPQNTSNQRKRPVALDFVDYPSSGPNIAKRPFTQSRQETSLIIDVSDESDDGEMEMDMDMGSPIEETMPAQSSGVSNQYGPLNRDLPPLTDTLSKRQLSSPAPSVTPPGGRVNRTTELDLKEKAIQEMRRKIALAEAKRRVKQSASGSVAPSRSDAEAKGSEGPRPPLTQTTESVSSKAGSERGSSGPTPEPSTTKQPELSETHLDPVQRAQRRGRIMSLEIPRVESSLSEKMKRLKQLQDEEERLKAEIERSIAEQKKLAEELQQLDTASPSTEAAMPNGSEAGNGGGQSFESQPEETSPNEQQDGESSVSQTGSVAAADAQTHRSSLTESVSDERTGEGLDEGQVPSNRSVEPPAQDGDSGLVGSATGDSADHPHTRVSESSQPKSDAVVQGNAGDPSIPSSELAPVANNAAASHAPEQMGSPNADETTPMELESQSPSPQAAERASSANAESPEPLPDQISGPVQPREAAQEIETEIAGEVQGPPVSKPESKLKPYQSPLRYFHAYRFHPEYLKVVAGGLRSLTYSNRIDPDKELCPFELTGEQCPANCEYQHFNSIVAPDEQILLELGSSDDLSADQRSGFVQGLKELLQKFRADKVKDFDTIARGIVEFRAQFLGDKSKVLRLEGVTI